MISGIESGRQVLIQTLSRLWFDLVTKGGCEETQSDNENSLQNTCFYLGSYLLTQ